MRPEVDVIEARRLASQGRNVSQIARTLGLSRATVRGWLNGTQRRRAVNTKSGCPRCDPEAVALSERTYAYLLGLYLGDGCLSEHARGVFRLRIVLDDHYPGIIDECDAAMRAVAFRAVQRVRRPGCTEVAAYWKHWPCLFPQHGPGKKHERTIALEPWQQEIVDRHPGPFLRGLIHSDGCRFDQTIAGRYRYPRYMFKNLSDDIRAMFCRACDVYGVAWRPSNRWTISVARREAVARLDEAVGPKE